MVARKKKKYATSSGGGRTWEFGVVQFDMPSNQAPHQFSVDHDGKTYSATYKVASGMVHVDSPYGSKSTQQGRLPAETVARMLLLGLLKTAKARGEPG